jgi:RNase P subunit RPR2
MDVYNNENLDENTQSQNPNRYVSGVYKLLYRYIVQLPPHRPGCCEKCIVFLWFYTNVGL